MPPSVNDHDRGHRAAAATVSDVCLVLISIPAAAGRCPPSLLGRHINPPTKQIHLIYAGLNVADSPSLHLASLKCLKKILNEVLKSDDPCFWYTGVPSLYLLHHMFNWMEPRAIFNLCNGKQKDKNKINIVAKAESNMCFQI